MVDADGKQLALSRAAQEKSREVTSKKMVTVAKMILTLEDQAMQSAEDSLRHAGETIKARVEVGKLLTEMKEELGHGNWIAWLGRHLSDLSSGKEIESIRRLAARRMELYLRLRDGMIDTKDARSVREAYILADLMPDASRSEASGKALNNGDDPLLVRITRLTGALASEIQRQPLTDWPDERKQVWRERLQPLASIYAQIQ